MKNNPVTGLKFVFRGANLIFLPQLRAFLLVPLLVNLGVFGGLTWFGVDRFTALLDWLLPESSWLSALRWLLWPLLGIALMLIIFNTFTLLINLIAAPFNGLLAEKVEEFLSGGTPTPDFGWRQMLKEVPGSLASELRKITYFAVRALPLSLLFIIPGVNIVAPILWLVFSAWYLTLEYADYPMSNHGLPFSEQLGRLRRTRRTALGFGAGLSLITMIPIINFIAMPAAVAAATAFWHKDLRERR